MKSTRDPNSVHCAGPAIPATESYEQRCAGLDWRPEGSGGISRHHAESNSAGNAAPIATRDHETRASPGRVKGRRQPSTE
jgi:hypothetical protein